MSDKSATEAVEFRGLSKFAAQHAWGPYVLVTITMLCFSGNTTLGRAIHADVPPMGLVFWRLVAVTVMIAPFVFREVRAKLPQLLRYWKLILLLGITQSATGQGLLYSGLHTTTAVNAGLLNAVQPAITMALAWLILRTTITRRQIMGLMVAIVGVAVIIAQGNLDTLQTLTFVAGDFLVLGAFSSWALYAVLVKRAPTDIEPFALFLAITIAGLIGMIPLYAGEILFTDLRIEFNLITIGSVLYIGLLGSVIALVFLNVAIAHIGPVRAGVFFYLITVFTALFGILILGESFHLYHLVGVGLVFGGVYLSTRARRRVAD